MTSASTLRLLVVEDNPGDFRIVEELLRESTGSGWHLDRAGLLSEALGRLATPPDAVLLDLGLPDSVGLDTVRRLCDAAPEVPVVVLTGFDDEVAGTAAVKAGAQDYLVKHGLDAGLLVRTVRHAIERKHNEEELARLAAIVESSDDAIAGTDARGIVRTWNASAARLFALAGTEAIGHEFDGIVPEGARPEIVPSLRRALGGESVSDLELRLPRTDGDHADVSLSLSPIRDAHGHVVGVSAIARDVTPLKRAQQLLGQAQKVESLGALAGGVAHHFNNLFAVALGRCHRALSAIPEGGPAAREVSLAVEALDRAAQISRQMVAFSGRGTMSVASVQLGALVERDVELLRAALPDTIELRLRLQPAPPVQADAGQLQQALASLVVNAREAIGDRGGTITVLSGSRRVVEDDERYYRYTGAALRAGRYVTLEVQDDGPGMAGPTLDRIFDPFFSTKFVGRGLGLATVLGVVRGHRGGVRVYSEVGRGTLFTLLFPAEDEEGGGDPDGERAAGTTAGGGTILVIDDETVFRDALADALRESGYEPVAAGNGSDGLALLWDRYGEFAAVILDLAMPGLGGEQVLSEMHRIDPGLPVILASGFALDHDDPRLASPAVSFVRKPFERVELIRSVRHAMARHRAPGVRRSTR